MRGAFIVGLSGQALTPDERTFLSDSRPAGIIVFARNISTPDQLKGLVDAALTAIGSHDTLVLVDQEGGRVQRLGPPHWRRLPPASFFARRHPDDPAAAAEEAGSVARLMAHELRMVGINCDCAPVLDVPVPGAHQIIGDRAYSGDPGVVSTIARAVAEGLMAGGVLPIAKHIPGHGRALVDSHLGLPRVDTEAATLSTTDFVPFKRLSALPAAMTAHVVFTAFDDEHPASTSRIVHDEVLRGEIGFDGLLVSDDLGMQALHGSMRSRAEAVHFAGSDLALHCSGNLEEMIEVAAGSPTLAGKPGERFLAALGLTHDIQPCFLEAADQVLSEFAAIAT